ncbi:MAG: type IV toxin-antitoxin system AbiEi family antitoxin domain-containing protein [Bacteroidales bacterium]|nr:type IV toxin-antitoxin system AbiEi family antitoxin domain-containing protein [Bacteroidales bacterium]
MLESIDDKILKSVMKRGRGVVFSIEEYAHYGDPDAVQKALSRMARKGVLLRVCHGIYCYPKIDKELGLGQLFPSYEDIAQVIAKRDKVRIFPAGALAQNMLGLSTQVPMNVVYLTDGSNRKVNVKNGRGILFRHVSPKKLAFNDKLAMLITTALRDLESNNVTDEHKKKLKTVLEQRPEPFSTHDMKLMPLWIRNLITELYEQLHTTH